MNTTQSGILSVSLANNGHEFDKMISAMLELELHAMSVPWQSGRNQSLRHILMSFPRAAVGSTKLGGELRNLMKSIPQPVVCVTVNQGLECRGLTCSSFTSVSLNPPIISFAIRHPSKALDLLKSSPEFAVNVLSSEQVALSVRFSSSQAQSDFSQVPHYFEEGGLPIIQGSLGSLVCRVERIIQVGDHHVCYGNVHKVIESLGSNQKHKTLEPLLYYRSNYSTVGDQVFIQAFQNQTLSFDDWTHRAHLRMGWIYLKEFGSVETALPKMRDGILRYNEANHALVKHGFNETITHFFAIMIYQAMQTSTDSEDFLDFVDAHPELGEFKYIFKFYTTKRLYSAQAVSGFITPDRLPLSFPFDQQSNTKG